MSTLTDAEMTSSAGAAVEGQQRVALRLAYQGALYSGWQRQESASTVQADVESSLRKLLKDRVVVVGAGRTDAGVHARAQWIHFDLPKAFRLESLVLGANSYLPREVRVLAAHHVSASFHAQHSALWKRYCYRIARHRVFDPLNEALVARSPGALDQEAMSAAAQRLLGRHDFSAFAKAGGSHDDPVREIYCAELSSTATEWRFRFEGNGFLRGMVRAMVGTLVDVGIGRRPAQQIGELLQPGRTRSEAGAAAPAKGLVLDHVAYPVELFLEASYVGDGGSPLLGED